MDQAEFKHLKDDEDPTMKTVKNAAIGLAAGSVWGAVIANLYGDPQLEKNVARPGLMRTLKGCGNYGLSLAALGGIYTGVEQLLVQQRKKRDFVNGAVGAFVAGAAVMGFKGRSISSAIFSGTALAATSALLDFSGETTRVDAKKETSTHPVSPSN